MNLISSGTLDAEGSLWYCTGFGGGAIKLIPGSEIAFEPNGPISNSVFAMSKKGNYLFTSGGGVTNTFGNAYNPAGFYIYNNFRWNSNPASPFNTGLYDYTFVHFNSVTEKLYLATHTNGMLEFTNGIATNRFDDNNAPFFRDPGSGFIRISGVANDKEGNLWVNNFGAEKPLLVYKSGTWTGIKVTESSSLKALVIDDNDYKWMIVQGNGILVYNDNKTPGNDLDDRSIRLTTSNGLITNDVLSLQVDQNGYVWIGTTQGLNVVTNTSDIFVKPKIDRFIIEQNGSTGYLLGEETINDICVDGGNRKWFATNNGVFLVEPNGQEVLVKYTADNSPLPDNRVYCIGQVSNSGEVFFGTDAGIASYRSDATDADEKFKKIKIYPNPVRPGYSGLVTIEGLAKNAEIRITDATGMLIYQTKANGGTATWPCTKLDGSKPESGVLYVFGINEEGTETSMGKFVFIK
jgi:ligand-binding sensor domain-containing protein